MAQRVIVIGAGAAGLIAAGRAAELGADVILLEKMREAGKKILVSGQERCNITNTAPLEKFLTHYGRNGRFLRNAYHRFFRDELLALLARYDVHTQEERGGRIFPASGFASDVRDALLRYATGKGADVRYLTEVNRILVEDGRCAGHRAVERRPHPRTRRHPGDGRGVVARHRLHRRRLPDGAGCRPHHRAAAPGPRPADGGRAVAGEGAPGRESAQRALHLLRAERATVPQRPSASRTRYRPPARCSSRTSASPGR